MVPLDQFEPNGCAYNGDSEIPLSEQSAKAQIARELSQERRRPLALCQGAVRYLRRFSLLITGGHRANTV